MTTMPQVITENPIPNRAIETDYRGVTFRSRLEAKWAAFFDLCGWPWQYEPVDLNGYIPDFILPMPTAPMLVEVKPVMYLKDFARYTNKIEKSGWTGEAMIVGAMIFPNETWSDASTIGLLAERDDAGAWDWEHSILQTCNKCNRTSFFHETGLWSCRVEGCYEGDHFLGIRDLPEVESLFSEASRLVRYKP